MKSSWKRLSGVVVLLIVGMVAFMPANTLQTNLLSSRSVNRAATGRTANQSNQSSVLADEKPASEGPVIIQPDHMDLSSPLSQIAPLTDSQTDPTLMRFQEHEVLPGREKEGSFGGVDAAYQNSHGPLAMPSPIQNWDGINNVGYTVRPPDTVGDVGLNHYIQWVNVRFQIWNKTGASLYGPATGNTLWSGFGGKCQTANDGDPVVVYDHAADRWVMLQFALGTVGDGTSDLICIAVSQTADPLGSWYRYSYTWPNTYLPDYPKLGIWPDGYYISVNQFNDAATAWRGAGVLAMQRSQMLTGGAAQAVYFDGYAYNTAYGGMLPADWEGATPPPSGAPIPFVEWDDSTSIAPSDALRVWNFHVDWATPANSYFGVAGSPFVPTYTVNTLDVDPTICAASPACIDQPGTTVMLHDLADRIMHRLQYRNFGSYQTLVSNHTVDTNSPAGRAGIHWFELRNTGSGWGMHQQGVYGPADTTSTSRWMGSIAMDGSGNVALGYSITDNVSLYPSVRYAGRLVSDPLNTLPQSEATLVTGGGYQNDSYNRWGDYSAMQVDPVDDCTFWYTQEYAQTSGAYNWYTRIGSFKFTACGAVDFSLAATPATVNVCAPADAQYTVAVTALNGFNSPVTLSASGNPAGTTATFTPNPVTPTANSTLVIGNTGAAAAGSYALTLTGASGALNHTANVTLNLSSAAPAAPTLTAPANGATGIATMPTFTWGAVAGASSYTLQVASDPGFTALVVNVSGLTATSYTPGSLLSMDTVYYWRVQAANACSAVWSSALAFRTQVNSCTTYTSTDVPKSIPDVGSVQSSLTVPDSFILTDVNVTLGSIVHTWDADLDISILHPDATSVELSTDNGGSGDNYTNTMFDDEAATSITAGTASFTGSFRPEGLLSALDGKTAAGVWKLNVTDDTGQDTGTLNAWSITLCGNLTAASADYSDLASSYGVAWHTGGGVLKLGATWTADTSFSANGDDASDDGVTFVGGMIPGQNATVQVAVQGTPANGRWLRLWFDWNNNGVFDSDERVWDAAAASGVNTLTVPVPAGLSSAAKYRVRLYDSVAAPTGGGEAIDASSYGAAAGGEVEDGVTSSPLAVTLAGFAAQQQGAAVEVTWETVSELSNAGFNVYRAASADGAKTLIAVVPSQAPGSAQGASYRIVDADVQAGETRWYWLEDIDLSGAATLHGPVSVALQAPAAVTLDSVRADTGAAPASGAWAVLVAIVALAAAGWLRRRSTRPVTR